MPVAGYRAGDDGSLWLQREDPGGDNLHWLIVRPDGTPRGHVRIPQSSTIMWVSGERAWIVERDELEVPWLVRIRITD